jgi:hypothetical protein
VDELPLRGETVARRRRGSLPIPPAHGQAVWEDKPQTEYMNQPVVVHGVQAQDVAVSCRVTLEGLLEAGIIARASFDEAYALLVKPGEALLCRYMVGVRHVLARRELPKDATECVLRLVIRGARISGSVRVGDSRFALAATDPGLMKAGFAGVVGNLLDSESRSSVVFRDFRFEAVTDPEPRTEEILYRFVGAIVPDG